MLSLRSLGCVVGVVNLCGSQQGFLWLYLGTGGWVLWLYLGTGGWVLWLYLGTGGWVLWFGVGTGTGFRVWENGKDSIEERQGWKSLSVTTWTSGGERKTKKEQNERMIVVAELTTKSFRLPCMYVHVSI